MDSQMIEPQVHDDPETEAAPVLEAVELQKTYGRRRVRVGPRSGKA